ncbi:MAG: hypothetical protein WC683_05880 [bacterium]
MTFNTEFLRERHAQRRAAREKTLQPPRGPDPLPELMLDLNAWRYHAFAFHGAHSNRFKLGPHVLEAVEDASDGYRSALEGVQLCAPDTDKGLFFAAPIATVEIWPIERHKGCFGGFELRDVNDRHVWLRFGTDYADHWYPMFVFEYHPKEPKTP